MTDHTEAGGREHDGCLYNAVLVKSGGKQYWFCNKCGWTSDADRDPT